MNLYLEQLRWLTGCVRREEQASLMFYQVAAHHVRFLSHWSCFQLTPLYTLLCCPTISLLTESTVLNYTCEAAESARSYFLIVCLRISFSGWVLTLKHCLHWPCVCGRDNAEKKMFNNDAEVLSAGLCYHCGNISRFLSVKSWMWMLWMLVTELSPHCVHLTPVPPSELK